LIAQRNAVVADKTRAGSRGRFGATSLLIGDSFRIHNSCLACLARYCNVVKTILNHPQFHQFYRWYDYHSQMGGLFLFFPHYLQWCPKKKRSPVPTVPKKFLSCPTEAVGRLTLYVCPKIMGKNLLKIDGCWWCFDDFPYENASFGGPGPPFSETPKWSHFGWSCDLWDPSCFWPKCWMLPLTEITHLDLWGYWETHQLIYIYIHVYIYIYAERESERD
jgi:hypothetical protein